MRNVSELNGRHVGEDIYIIGTGASMRVFPQSLFEGKITIGLNMAWKLMPVRYAVTIHPDLNVPEFMPGETAHPQITWIAKYGKTRAVVTPDQLVYAEKNFYFFESDGRPNSQPADEPSDAGRIVEWVKRPTDNKLYQWSSISQTAVNLAANMGARNIFLAGCDNCALLDNHHAHDQHTRWKGALPAHRYAQYTEGLAEIRAALRERGVNLVSLTPFLSLESPAKDFERLCTELDRPAFIANRDVSPHVKAKTAQAAPDNVFVRGVRRLLKISA